MNSKLLSACCGECTHTKETPCSNLIECITNGPVCHTNATCTAKRETRLREVRRHDHKDPIVFIGTGTCGLGAGAGETRQSIADFFAGRNMDADIIDVGCIGLCSQEPIMDVKLPGKARIAFGNVDSTKAQSLLTSLMEDAKLTGEALYQFSETGTPWKGVNNINAHPFFKTQKRFVLSQCGIMEPGSLDEYLAGGGYGALATTLKTKTSTEVCKTVLDSGLRGRGGGGFPTGKKWQFALKEESDQKYFICNADEGDPGAFMDRAVIEGDPHRVLEGLILSSYAIGASVAYVYLRAEYPLAIRQLTKAIENATTAGLLGENILDSGFSLKVKIKQGAGAFVCGEETALIHSIEGKRGMPRPRPPFPAVKGLFDKPTIINNVETLANIPGILANGTDWFKGVGTENSKGTKVFALSGNVQRTGLVEVGMGTSIRDIVFNIGGGIPDNKSVKAVQMGGPSGGCIPDEHLDIEIDYESLKSVGAMMGSGGMVVMDEDICMVDVASFFMDFIQRESCGKCIPCREGTKQLLDILGKIKSGRKNNSANDSLDRFKGIIALRNLSEVIKNTSLCGLGQTAPNPILSTLRWFKDEYESHIYERRCPAGVCTELITYKVDEETCKGCTICAKKCPSGAIKGSVKSPHYIAPEKCVKCGVCIEVCPVDAISKISAPA